MISLFWLFSFGVLAGFWIDTLRARETAITLCARACQRHALQLLDQTVALEGLSLCRQPRTGWLCLQRRYRFEFSDDGNQRLRGSLVLRGRDMLFLDLPGYYERVISADNRDDTR